MTPLGDAIEIFSISRQHSFQMLHDSLRCLPVPERRDRSFFPLSGHQSSKTRLSVCLVCLVRLICLVGLVCLVPLVGQDSCVNPQR